MTSVMTRVGDNMATQKRQEPFAQTNSGAVSPEQRTNRSLTEKHGYEEWKQRIEEDWQYHLETLQQYACELLRRSQQLRMALMTANEPKRGYGDAISLQGGQGSLGIVVPPTLDLRK
jgi:hypothetical protein